MGRPKGSKNRPTPSTLSGPQPLPTPSNRINPTNYNVQWGVPLNPVQRLKSMPPNEWEDFVREWAESLKTEYHDVQRCGGSGDQGRDVVAYVTEAADPWDNYQCKHYKGPLGPGQIWVELGKLCYYTFTSEFGIPRRYYFVAPEGVGTKLSKLIDKPIELRSQLIQEWGDKCETEITSTGPIKLEGKFLDYVKSFDFSIIKRISVGRIIEQHQATRYHVIRFGGGLPSRPDPDKPPDTISSEEARYVTPLVEAYSEHTGRTLKSVDELRDRQDLTDHFRRCREHFYCAESLRNFSRDHLPHDEFEKLQNEIHDGIIDVVSLRHADGYERVVKTIQKARRLQITDHPLLSCLHTNDRSGICHQLANDNRLVWVQKS